MAWAPLVGALSQQSKNQEINPLFLFWSMPWPERATACVSNHEADLQLSLNLLSLHGAGDVIGLADRQ
jgi:hypothetical protein